MRAERKVLLVEDDEAMRTLTARHLEVKGYAYLEAVDGAEGLRMYSEHPVPVVITDLYMPRLDGLQLIRELNKLADPPVVIMLSGEDDVQRVIDVMREGVSDYLIKPIRRADFYFKVEKAFELADAKLLTSSMRKEREILHSQKIDWSLWKYTILNRENQRTGLNVFENIRTSLNQSAGFGGLISMVSLLRMQAKETPDGFLVPAAILPILYRNADMAAQAMATFDEIGKMISGKYVFLKIKVSDFLKMLIGEARSMRRFARIRNHRIHIQKSSSDIRDRHFYGDLKSLQSAVREMLLNAFKFSEESSEILISTEWDSKNSLVVVSFLNAGMPNKSGENIIPEEYAHSVFEPFFRLVSTVDERYESVDFGIGLTLVQKIMEKNKATVSVRSVTAFSALKASQSERVCFDLKFHGYSDQESG